MVEDKKHVEDGDTEEGSDSRVTNHQSHHLYLPHYHQTITEPEEQ